MSKTTTAADDRIASAVARDPHWSAKMDRLRARKPVESWVSVPLDVDAKSKLSTAEMELVSARARAERENGKSVTDTHPLVAAQATARDQAKAHLDENTIRLGFRGLPRDVYEKLMADHPPTPEQESKGEIYDVDTFPAALISACSVDGMPEADAIELVRGWNQAEVSALFQAAIYVNTSSRVELGKG